ncbi:hypothetical protein Tco_0017017 [Tanacetum coccineum]
MGRGTWYYSLGVSSIVDAFVRSEFGISSWHGSRVDGRSYLLSGAIDGRSYLLSGAIDCSEANGIIRDPKLGELVEISNRNFVWELVQGATPNCEGSCRLTSLERQEVWNGCRSCKVRVSSNGNLLWEVSVLLDRKEGCVMDTLKFAAMPFGLTNAPAVFIELIEPVYEKQESHLKNDRGATEGREGIREYFQQRGREAKRKLSRGGRNQMVNVSVLCMRKLWVVEGLTLKRCSMFGKKDKLEPSYVGPFEILGWIGPIVRLRILSYELSIGNWIGRFVGWFLFGVDVVVANAPFEGKQSRYAVGFGLWS